MSHDPRYLKGIELFNAHEFHPAHDAWEEMWLETFDERKKFLQGLIKAAVCLHHYSRENFAGARTLYHGMLDLLEPYRPKYMGLDVDNFLRRMRGCFHKLIEAEEPSPRLNSKTIPTIKLEE